MEYYFQENLRWSLGWETPNQAGAFLAMLLPLCWMVSVCLWLIVWGKTANIVMRLTASLGMLAVVAGEVWLWWALAKTYSRGAWVGLGCGVVAWGLLMIWSKWSRADEGSGEPATQSAQTRRPRRVSNGWLGGVSVILRVAVIVTCLLVSNFSARLAPDYTRSDRSALNRIDLWKGGLELVAASPLRGWGWGESGAAYMQWTQPLDRTEGYKSMVNSYLTVVVEAGLPVFALLLAGMLVPLALGAWLARRTTDWPLALVSGLSACWSVWLGCLFFSNLWIIPKLWMVPGMAAVVLVGWSVLSLTRWFGLPRLLAGAPVSEREQARGLPDLHEKPFAHAAEPACPAITPYFGTALATALVMGLALWLGGSFLACATPLQLTRESDSIVRLAPRGKVASDWLEVYPDAAVLGESYGHELRRWLLVAKNTPALRIQSPDAPVVSLDSAHAAVIFGEQAGRVSLAGRKICIVHPIGAPPAGIMVVESGSCVILASIDSTGARYEWEAWAQGRGLRSEVNYGLSTDVRVRWPATMQNFEHRQPN